MAALRILEDATEKAPSLEDRVFAGFAAFCTHTRSRCADAARIGLEPYLDGSHIAAAARPDRWKTGRKQRRKGELIPVAGHAVGLSGESWAERWLEARVEAGLDAGTDDCLMPAPLPGGGLSKARLPTSEACVWLRELLVAGGIPAGEAMRYSSHSTKAAFLAWAAVFPLTHDERRVLGGHIAPGDRSVLTYSRGRWRARCSR